MSGPGNRRGLILHGRTGYRINYSMRSFGRGSEVSRRLCRPQAGRRLSARLGVPTTSLLPSSTKSAAIVRVAPHENGTVMFVIDPVPEVTIPCRIVVVRISGEIVIVDDSGCRSVDRSRSINRCRRVDRET